MVYLFTVYGDGSTPCVVLVVYWGWGFDLRLFSLSLSLSLSLSSNSTFLSTLISHQARGGRSNHNTGVINSERLV